MSENYRDDFETGSGLPLANGVEGEIVDMAFGYDNTYAAGKVVAKITVQVEGRDPVTQIYSTGTDWEPGNDGTMLVDATGSGRKINNSTGFGLLLDRVKELDKEMDGKVIDDMAGSARNVSSWLGTRWAWESVVLPGRKNPVTGVVKDSTTSLPEKYLGRNSDVTPVSSGSSSTTTTAKPELDPELRETLLTAAKEAADHKSFMTAVWDSIEGNPAGENAVMSTKPGSIWHEAHGK